VSKGHRGKRSKYAISKRAALAHGYRDRELAETVFTALTLERVHAALDQAWPDKYLSSPFTPGDVLVDSRGKGVIQRRTR